MAKKQEFTNGGFYNYRPSTAKYRKPNITLWLTRAVTSLIIKKPKIEWRTEIPDEPVLYVCNHTKLYAPSGIVVYYQNIRLWANASFMSFKECWKHTMTKVLKNRKWLFPVAVLIMPFEVIAFRQMEHIPVYHDTAVMETFRECSRCLQSGRSSMVFRRKASQ